jgi:hypothetical protein
MKKLHKLFLSTVLFLSSTKIANAVSAAPSGGAGSSIFGTIEPPAGVDKYGDLEQGGLILFASNGIRLATTVAGVWVMLNFILAGWKYISGADNSKSASEAAQMMTNSVIGLAIIVGSYTLAAIAGLVFFGDASYILNPKITGV